MILQEKWFSCYILLTDQISLSDSLYPLQLFEINLIFLIKPFLYMTKKSKQKLKYLENEQSFYKYFPSFLKTFQLPKIVSDQSVHL